jgi:hypothetical protein
LYITLFRAESEDDSIRVAETCCCYLLLNKRYNSCRVWAFSTIFIHSWRSWACSVHLSSFTFLRSFLTSSSHLCLGLPTGRVIYGCHLYIFFTMLISGFLYICVRTSSVFACCCYKLFNCLVIVITLKICVRLYNFIYCIKHRGFFFFIHIQTFMKHDGDILFWFDALLRLVVRIKAVTRPTLNCKYTIVFVAALCVFYTQLPTLTSVISILSSISLYSPRYCYAIYTSASFRKLLCCWHDTVIRFCFVFM